MSLILKVTYTAKKLLLIGSDIFATELKFDSAEALIEEMENDKIRAKEILNANESI